MDIRSEKKWQQTGVRPVRLHTVVVSAEWYFYL